MCNYKKQCAAYSTKKGCDKINSGTVTCFEEPLTTDKAPPAPLPDCDICHQHQTEPGAVKISAPRKIDGLEGMWCKKIHICVDCIKGEVT